MGGFMVFVVSLIYIVVIIIFFVLFARLVCAFERMAQSIDIGVATWMKTLGQKPGSSEQQPPPQ